MGIVVERVLTKDYRFNAAYQQAIEDKKIADQKTEQNKSARKAKEEEYKRRLEDTKGEVNKLIAKADGNYKKTRIQSDAYYEKQKMVSKAIIAEGKAEYEAVRKMNQALAAAGGKTFVKFKIAESLEGKKIILIPTNSGNGMNLQTLDMNKLLNIKGAQNLSKKSTKK